MEIKYRPRSERAPDFIVTNLGEFHRGDVKMLMTEQEIEEGKRLIANGDFADLASTKPAKTKKNASKKSSEASL